MGTFLITLVRGPVVGAYNWEFEERVQAGDYTMNLLEEDLRRINRRHYRAYEICQWIADVAIIVGVIFVVARLGLYYSGNFPPNTDRYVSDTEQIRNGIKDNSITTVHSYLDDLNQIVRSGVSIQHLSRQQLRQVGSSAQRGLAEIKRYDQNQSKLSRDDLLSFESDILHAIPVPNPHRSFGSDHGMLMIPAAIVVVWGIFIRWRLWRVPMVELHFWEFWAYSRDGHIDLSSMPTAEPNTDDN